MLGFALGNRHTDALLVPAWLFGLWRLRPASARWDPRPWVAAAAGVLLAAGPQLPEELDPRRAAVRPSVRRPRRVLERRVPVAAGRIEPRLVRRPDGAAAVDLRRAAADDGHHLAAVPGAAARGLVAPPHRDGATGRAGRAAGGDRPGHHHPRPAAEPAHPPSLRRPRPGRGVRRRRLRPPRRAPSRPRLDGVASAGGVDRALDGGRRLARARGREIPDRPQDGGRALRAARRGSRSRNG